ADGGARGSPAPGGRRGRYQPERQQHRLLPGQSDRMGGLVQSRARGRGCEHDGGTACDAAPALSTTSPATLDRWAPPGRLVRRALVDAEGDRDDGTGLEFSRGAVLVLCPRL